MVVRGVNAARHPIPLPIRFVAPELLLFSNSDHGHRVRRQGRREHRETGAFIDKHFRRRADIYPHIVAVEDLVLLSTTVHRAPSDYRVLGWHTWMFRGAICDMRNDLFF